MKSLPRLPLHPFLFAVYPVLFLLAVNAAEVEPRDAVRSLVVAVCLAGALLLFGRLLLRDWTKAAVLASLMLILFFSYGHLYVSLRGVPAVAGVLGRHRTLLLIETTLVIACFLLLRRRRPPDWVTAALNGAAAVAVGLALAQALAAFAGIAGDGTLPEPSEAVTDLGLALPARAPAPDVYYIILDAYTRADVLDELFDYDNRPFLDGLEALGFSVADKSRSNYAVTRLSVPSSLNFDYLDAIGPPLDPEDNDAAWLDRATRYSRVRSAFESLGYKIVAFESAVGMTDWVDADLYLSRSPLALSDAQAFWRINPFEVLLTQTSMGRLVVDGRTFLNRILHTDIKSPNEQHRLRILFDIDRLAQMPSVPGPKFVFVHIMSPHPPSVFTADGGVVEDKAIFTLAGDSTPGAAERKGYADQVAYLNARLLDVFATIIADSPTEPIIIVQGDHGALGVSSEDRMKILNAYYLPQDGRRLVYDAITPVNTFRLIFNEYFGGALPLLEDRSYFSPPEEPFLLTPLP